MFSKNVKGTVYCIENYGEKSKREKFTFKKGKYYKITYSSNIYEYLPIKIYDDNNNVLQFHPESDFNRNEVCSYFIEITELRKQKLLKINKT